MKKKGSIKFLTDKDKLRIQEAEDDKAHNLRLCEYCGTKFNRDLKICPICYGYAD